jgi:RNA polymerase sigma factor (TIGR02999 family)
MSDVTQILQAIDAGDPNASEELLPLVYDELRKLAGARLAREPSGQTLQATALVHEAWIRLSGAANQEWNSRGHFFGAAAEAMRRILIDRARKRKRVRHGGDLARVNLDSVVLATTTDDESLLRLDEALEKLTQESPEKAKLVKLRYFAGLSLKDAAAAMEISPATAKRHWAYARAWLLFELKGN